MGEQAWHLFARGTASATIVSTLTLPVLMGREVVGSVDLYASTLDAFSDKHEQIAAAVGG